MQVVNVYQCFVHDTIPCCYKVYSDSRNSFAFLNVAQAPDASTVGVDLLTYREGHHVG